ncbi:MAG: hypothetical protein Q7S34_01750 [bacterium]|nr:hypothetical protein [bacterium]
MSNHLTTNTNGLPDFFKPIFWSYNFNSLNPETNKKTIIIQTINYGDLKHWRWIVNRYGRETIKSFLSSVNFSEIRPRAGKLASIIFNFEPNYAPRGAN